MEREIDDIDIKILEAVKPFDKRPATYDAILGLIGETIQLDELMDRLDILQGDHGFVKIADHPGTGSGGLKDIWSTPKGRQYLRDLAAKQAKLTDALDALLP